MAQPASPGSSSSPRYLNRNDLIALPKAHLHLHFTGSLRRATVQELALQHGFTLPPQFERGYTSFFDNNASRGWFRFQRLYDAARACVRTEADMRRVVREAAEDDAAEGSRWLELQIDPTSYAPRVGGMVNALEIVLDEARQVTLEGILPVAIIVAASRMKHPLDARTLARLAVRYAQPQPGHVVGFGLSNDERRGITAEFGPAFSIAAHAGLLLVPHGGELLGPESVDDIIAHLRPHRIGHGVRSIEASTVVSQVRDLGITLEVCPGSNVELGVYAEWGQVPVPQLLAAGVPLALGADDPLLFGTRLVDQYVMMARTYQLQAADLARLARQSVLASAAPPRLRSDIVADIDQWEAARRHALPMPRVSG